MQHILDFETSGESNVAVTCGAAIEKLRRTIRADLRSSLRLQHDQFSPELSTTAEDSF